MKVQEFVQNTYRKWTGKIDYPQPGSDTYKKILAWGNYYIREVFAKDSEHKWASCFEQRDGIGTISADTRTYDLDDDVTNLSDAIYVQPADGSSEVKFKVVPAKDRHKYQNRGNYAYKSSRDPAQVTFIGAGGMPAALVGGTINAGCYVIPAEVSGPNETMPVDRPSWLVARVSAELTSTDRSQDEKYADRIAEANEEYRLMAADNDTPVDDGAVEVEGYDRLDGECL